MTWFRHQLPADTVRIDGTTPIEDQVGRVLDAWRHATMEEEG
jgi:hypothetical protein